MNKTTDTTRNPSTDHNSQNLAKIKTERDLLLMELAFSTPPLDAAEEREPHRAAVKVP